MRVLVNFLHQTQKALLCTGARWNNEKNHYDINNLVKDEFWLPKSQIMLEQSFLGKSFIGEDCLHIVKVPGWLVEKHGLKRYEFTGEIHEAPPRKFVDYSNLW